MTEKMSFLNLNNIFSLAKLWDKPVIQAFFKENLYILM